MSAALTFVPSKSALRLLRHLALAGSTIGAFGGLVSVHQAIYRQTQCLEKAIEQKRLLQSLSNQNSAAHLNQLFLAAEAGQLAGLRSSRKPKARSTSQATTTGEPPNEPLSSSIERSKNHRILQSKKPLYLSASTAQRIIDSTLQQHKPQSYAVYSRPRTKRPKARKSLDTPVEKCTSENRIVEASLVSHKSSQHYVHWRPEYHKRSPTLAGCVDLWLRSGNQKTSTAESSDSTTTSSSSEKPAIVHRDPRRPSLRPQSSGIPDNSATTALGLKPTSRSFTTLSRSLLATPCEMKRIPTASMMNKKPSLLQAEKDAIPGQSVCKHKLSIKLTRCGSTVIRYHGQI